MKKINVKKALASVAALSVVACMAAIPASAAEHTFATSSKQAAVVIEDVTVTLDELAAANYQVPVLVKVKPNPGVNALEFGVSCAETYDVVAVSKTAKTYADLATANADIADGLDVKMTFKQSTVVDGLTWLTFADSDVVPEYENFVLLVVTVPSTAKAGDVIPVTYAAQGAGDEGAAKSNLFQVKENGTTTDYVADGNFEGISGSITIEGGEETTTTTTTTETTTTTTTTTTETETTTTTTTTETDTTTTTTTTTAATTTTTAGTTAATTTTAASSTGSPKTGASDVLPIAGAAAAVAVLGGVALVAKKKND